MSDPQFMTDPPPRRRWSKARIAIVAGVAAIATTVSAVGIAAAAGSTPTAAAVSPDAISGYGGKCVDVAAANSANGTQVQLYTCNGTAAQQWIVGTDGTIASLGKCLDVASAGTANGAKVQIYDCNGTAAQKWQATSGELVNTGSGKCLDATGPSSADGTPLQIWTCTGAANQLWTPPIPITSPSTAPPTRVTNTVEVPDCSADDRRPDHRPARPRRRRRPQRLRAPGCARKPLPARLRQGESGGRGAAVEERVHPDDLQLLCVVDPHPEAARRGGVRPDLEPELTAAPTSGKTRSPPTPTRWPGTSAATRRTPRSPSSSWTRGRT